MTAKTPQPRVLSSNSIDVPLSAPSETTVSRYGTVALAGTVTDLPLDIRARVFRSSDTIPGSPTSDSVTCNFNDPNFSHPAVPFARGALGTANTDNVMVVWFKRPNGSWEIVTASFIGKSSNNFTVQVSAKHCVWMTWAPTNAVGPYGEDYPDYFPKGLAVPSDATGVTTTATGTWRHDPADREASGPDGLNGMGGLPNEQRGLEDTAYKHAQYHSDGIAALTTFVNELVGIWDINFTPPVAENERLQIRMGASYSVNTIPTGATRLFLACHDGYQWTDNSQSIDVTVQWKT